MIPDLANGILPLGRYPATAEQLASWPVEDMQRRAKLLDDWTQLTGALREALGSVAASWLGGSFLSSKEQPGDLDVVYWVHYKLLDHMSSAAQQLVGLVNSEHGAKQYLHLELDAFVLSWWPRAGPGKGTSVPRLKYLENRGYFDDLWSRARHDDLKIAKLPRRGYLEVIHDGYEEPVS